MHQSDGHKFILVEPWDVHFKTPHAEKTQQLEQDLF